MSTFSGVEIILGALIGLVLSMIILLVLQFRSSSLMNKLTYPAYEYVIKQSEHKANLILEQAQKEAREITAEAEKAGQKILGNYTDSSRASHDAFVKNLEQFTHGLTSQLSDTTNNGMAQLQAVTSAAKQSLEKEQSSITAQVVVTLETAKSSSEMLQKKVSEAVLRMEENIASVSDNLAHKLQDEHTNQTAHIQAHLQKALDAAESQIESYQKSRIALLDRHIERLVEDITKRVLHKQLSIDDHAELARAALSEAKEHNLL